MTKLKTQRKLLYQFLYLKQVLEVGTRHISHTTRNVCGVNWKTAKAVHEVLEPMPRYTAIVPLLYDTKSSLIGRLFCVSATSTERLNTYVSAEHVGNTLLTELASGERQLLDIVTACADILAQEKHNPELVEQISDVAEIPLNRLGLLATALFAALPTNDMDYVRHICNETADMYKTNHRMDFKHEYAQFLHKVGMYSGTHPQVCVVKEIGANMLNITHHEFDAVSTLQPENVL